MARKAGKPSSAVPEQRWSQERCGSAGVSSAPLSFFNLTSASSLSSADCSPPSVETWPDIALVGPELPILQPLPRKRWDYRHAWL